MKNLEELTGNFEKEFCIPGNLGLGDYFADVMFAGGVGIIIPAAMFGAYNLLFLGGFAAVSGAILRGVRGYVRWYYQKGPGKGLVQTNQ